MTKFPYLFIFLMIITLISQAVKLNDDDGKESVTDVDQMIPDMAVIMSQCNETYFIEISYLDSLNSSGSFPDETHETPKCYLDCLLGKLGVLAAAGVFDAMRAAVVFGGARGGRVMDDVEDMSKVCAETIKEEPSNCERAYGFMKCLMQMQVEKYEINDQSENQGKVDYSKIR